MNEIMDDLSQFRDTYFAECDELLRDVEPHLATLQDGSADGEAMNTVFRAVHSIKAGAGVFKFTELVEFTHIFEALLDQLRDGRVSLTEELVELLFRANDVLADLIAAAADGSDPPVAVAEALGRRIVGKAGIGHRRSLSVVGPGRRRCPLACPSAARDPQPPSIDRKPLQRTLSPVGRRMGYPVELGQLICIQMIPSECRLI